MRRPLRVAAVGFFVAAAAVLGWPASTAWASAPSAQGWWYFPQQSGSPVAVPAPPVVPPNGLYVAQGPGGQNIAIAAVQYAVPGYVEATLTLTLAAGAVGTVAITACPASAGFTPASAGAWNDAPYYNCTAAAADGVVDSAGTSVKFSLSSAFVAASGSTMDIVLVPTPASDPFQAPVAQPGEDSFQASTLPNVPADTGPPPAADSGFASASDFSSGSVSSPAPGDLFGASGSLPSSGGVGGASAGGGARRPVARPPVAVAAHKDPAGDRAVAVAVLALMGGALWWLSGRPLPSPRLLGGAAGSSTAEATVAEAVPGRMGGIGRFARPRSAAPNRL